MAKFEPDLTDLQVIGDAQRDLTTALAKGDGALADWARRYGQPAIDALEDMASGYSDGDF